MQGGGCQGNRGEWVTLKFRNIYTHRLTPYASWAQAVTSVHVM